MLGGVCVALSPCRSSTERQAAVQQRGQGAPPDVVLDEAHVLAAQPRREHVLHREAGRAELVRREHEAQREHDIRQSEGGLRTIHAVTPLEQATRLYVNI